MNYVSEYEHHAYSDDATEHDSQVGRYRTLLAGLTERGAKAVLGNVFMAVIANPDEKTAQCLWRQMEAHQKKEASHV